jgi:hypothetical protein
MHDVPWGALPLKVFLSHLYNERVYVHGVKEALATCGMEAFVAHDDIQPSMHWRDVIKAALRTCDAMVALLHPGFHESQWCDQEVGWVLGRGVPLIVVRSPDSPRRDGFMEESQDMRLMAERDVANSVLEVLLRDPRTRPQGLRSLAEAVVGSISFDRTRYLVGLLVDQPEMEEEQLRRLEYAVQTNRQVYEAVYPSRPPNRPVPELIAEFIARRSPTPSPSLYDEEPF